MNNEITIVRLKGLLEAMHKIAMFYMDEDDEIASIVIRGDEYQPHKDWNQCGEVLEWLIKEFGCQITYNRCFLVLENDEPCFNYEIEYKEFPEAIVLAALAYVESGS